MVQQIKEAADGATELQISETEAELKQLLPEVKELALSARKTNAQTPDE